MRKNAKSGGAENLLKLRDAALDLGVSFPTIKQWIYKKKIRSVQTAGGHHRIPQTEIDRLLFRKRGHNENERKQAVRARKRAQSTRGANRCGAHQWSDGGGCHFDRRAANHFDHHRAIGARDATQAGADRGGAD